MQPSATSRLIRVCDVFEALTAVRPYKRALTPVEAFAVMHRRPEDFDARWLSTFVRTLGLFPNGTRVQLNDGSDGVVVAQTEAVERPRVRLLSGPFGAALPADHPGQLVVGQRSTLSRISSKNYIDLKVIKLNEKQLKEVIKR